MASDSNAGDKATAHKLNQSHKKYISINIYVNIKVCQMEQTAVEPAEDRKNINFWPHATISLVKNYHYYYYY